MDHLRKRVALEKVGHHHIVGEIDFSVDQSPVFLAAAEGELI